MILKISNKNQSYKKKRSCISELPGIAELFSPAKNSIARKLF